LWFGLVFAFDLFNSFEGRNFVDQYFLSSDI